MARFNRLIGSQFILLDNSMQTIKKKAVGILKEQSKWTIQRN
jgi:hypothetical protein